LDHFAPELFFGLTLYNTHHGEEMVWFGTTNFGMQIVTNNLSSYAIEYTIGCTNSLITSGCNISLEIQLMLPI
jgi:accessory gene regulator protein AgrB